MDWDKDPLAGACTQGLWDLHITLVCVHSVKQGLRGHPLDRQAALEGEEGGQWVPGTPLGPACCPRPLPAAPGPCLLPPAPGPGLLPPAPAALTVLVFL